MVHYALVTLILFFGLHTSTLSQTSDDCATDCLPSPPTIVRLPIGASLRLECGAAKRVNWHRGRKRLKENERVFIDEDGSLQVARLLREDVGVYQCRGEDFKIAKAYRVIVHSGAFIVSPPRDVTISEGATVRFDCRAEDANRNATITWWMGEVKALGEESPVRGRVKIDPDGTLIISSVRHTDSGIFRCSAYNGVGNAAAAEATLSVTFSPKIVHMPKKVYLPLEYSAEIHCHFDSNPRVSRVIWKKDGNVVDVESEDRLDINAKDGQSLVIKKVLPKDAGRYSCRATNDLGTGPESSITEAKVRDPPRFIKKPKYFYQAMVRGTVTFPCMATGNPQPIISWRKTSCPYEKFAGFQEAVEKYNSDEFLFADDRYKRGFEFPGSNAISTEVSDATPCRMPRGRFHTWPSGNLTLIGLEPSDAGSFECVVRSAVMTLTATTLLIVETAPRLAPYDVTVSNATWRSLTVSWKPAFRPGFALKHLVWFRRVDGAEGWRTVRPSSSSSLGLVIVGLLPAANYEVSVLAETRSARGNFSGVIRAKTAPLPYGDLSFEVAAMLPPAPPINVKLTSFAHGVNVTWDAPPGATPPTDNDSNYDSPRLPPTGYVVQRARSALNSKDVGSNGLRWTTVSDFVSGRLFWTNRNLMPGSAYYFRVVAFAERRSFSLPSRVVVYRVAGSIAPRVNRAVASFIPPATLAGLGGGILFLFLSLLLALVATCLRGETSPGQRLQLKRQNYFGSSSATAQHPGLFSAQYFAQPPRSLSCRQPYMYIPSQVYGKISAQNRGARFPENSHGDVTF